MQIHHLLPKLKKVRLSGMLETLPMRIEQARSEKLDCLEFLEILLEDETQRRANHSFSRRIMRAEFEEIKTIEDFDLEFNPQIPKEKIRELATCGFIERKESVILTGPVGVGKSHIAQALGYAACRSGYSVVYMTAPRLFADLGGGRADNTWQERLQYYLKCEILDIDDFGLKELTSVQGDDFYELICGRYRKSSTIISSIRPVGEWYALFPSPVIAESALDRFINSAHHIVFSGKSYRPVSRPDKVEKNYALKKNQNGTGRR